MNQKTAQPAATLPDRLRGPALWLAVLLLAATVMVWLLGVDVRRDSVILNLIGSLVFVTASSIVIAALSIRSFRRTGAWPVLWLGAGSLALGIAVPLSSAFLALFGANAGVTMHNLGALLAAMLHAVGAFFTVNRIAAAERGHPRASVLRQVYGVTFLALTLIAAGAAFPVLPPFFIQGVGGTPIRQIILGLALALFLFSGLVFFRHYARTRSLMVYWYALGLMLSSLGLAGILLISATGTPLNWLGRMTQWVSGTYLLVAAWVTWSEARARNLPPGEVLAGYFLRSEASLRHLFESIQDAIIVTDAAFNIIYWNRGAEAIYGWAADEVTGRPARDVLQTEWLTQASRASVTATVQAGGSTLDEVSQLHKSGHRIVVLSAVSGYKDDDGRVLGAVAINRDITGRRAAEEEIRRLNAGLTRRAAELEASNRELEAFAYSVSHDLRAPLRGIAGYAEALEEDCAAELGPTGHDYLRLLRQNALRMSDLIDDLLALSRVGRQQIERIPVDMVQIARSAWDELSGERAGCPVELRIGPPDAPGDPARLPPATADPTLVKQVYVNLLSNALKFTRGCTAALVEIGCEDIPAGPTQPATVRAYYVRDNGIGFDMEHAEQIFGVFQRLHRSEEVEGTGVGLAIVRRIAERHGGRTWAVSAPGQGATFYFTLDPAP